MVRRGKGRVGEKEEGHITPVLTFTSTPPFFLLRSSLFSPFSFFATFPVPPPFFFGGVRRRSEAGKKKWRTQRRQGRKGGWGEDGWGKLVRLLPWWSGCTCKTLMSSPALTPVGQRGMERERERGRQIGGKRERGENEEGMRWHAGRGKGERERLIEVEEERAK